MEKGPVDGIGGTVKPVVSSAVSSREAIVMFLSKLQKKIARRLKSLLFQKAIQRDYNDNDLKNFWKEISAVSGTLNIHSVTPNGDGISVLLKIYSSSSNNKRHVLLKDIDLATNNTDQAEVKICNRNYISQFSLGEI